MKAVLLANVLHKGQRYSAGAELNLDAVTAGIFERAGLAFIEPTPKATPPKSDGSPSDLPQVEKKTRPAGKKTSTPKKRAGGKNEPF